MNSKAFWLVINATVIALYAVAGVLLAQGQSSHWVVLLAGVIVAAHVLEIPVAARVLKEKNPSMGRLAIFTIVFGFTWWVPVKMGIYRT